MEPVCHDILRHLTDLVEKLGIQVRYEILGDDEISGKGGQCRLRDQQLLIVDRRLPVPEKIKLFLEVLRRHDLESLFIPPVIRTLLEDDAETPPPAVRM